MMIDLQRRKFTRVPVSIPISCTFIDKNYKAMLSVGQVSNLSLGGMNVSIPANLDTLRSHIINYYLILPGPFSHISGNSKVRWLEYNESSRHSVMGMEFLNLEHTQRKDLESIVKELSESDPLIN